jgi:hypothetical protein
MIRSVIACLILAVLSLFFGCADSLIAQSKPSRYTAGSAGTGGAVCDASWWDRVTGLGVLNMMGGGLILLGGLAFVGGFVPAIGSLFPKKMALSCVLAGVGSIFLYNLLTEFAWVVYLTLGVGLVFLGLSYWPSIAAMTVKVWELVKRKDLDGDNMIGPKSGAD